MKQPRVLPGDPRTRRGSVLVEFAFICLAFYLLFAGTIELGRMITVSQIVQNAARVGARELALVARRPSARFDEPFDPTNPHFNDPDCQLIRQRIYDPRLLAVVTSGGDPDTTQWPVVNRMLYPAMIRSQIGAPGTPGQTLLHYPGAIISLPGGGYSVVVPHVVSRDASGAEQIHWLPVLGEVRSIPSDPNSGPYGLDSTGPDRGLVALRITYPYQATTLTAYRTVGTLPDGTTPQQAVVEAHDEAVSADNPIPMGGALQNIQPTAAQIGRSGAYDTTAVGGSNVGPYGLGAFVTGAGAMVRPFRRLITCQSLFRREVFAQ